MLYLFFFVLCTAIIGTISHGDNTTERPPYFAIRQLVANEYHTQHNILLKPVRSQGLAVPTQSPPLPVTATKPKGVRRKFKKRRRNKMKKAHQRKLQADRSYILSIPPLNSTSNTSNHNRNQSMIPRRNGKVKRKGKGKRKGKKGKGKKHKHLINPLQIITPPTNLTLRPDIIRTSTQTPTSQIAGDYDIIKIIPTTDAYKESREYTQTSYDQREPPNEIRSYDEFLTRLQHILHLQPNPRRPKTPIHQNSIAKKFTTCGSNKCDHICTNKTLSTCACYRGFRLSNDQFTCRDINECGVNNGNCTHKCRNMPGLFTCSCPKGLRLGDDRRSCDDVNECLLRNGHGPCQDTCVNTRGSYKCGCERLLGAKLSPDRRSCDFVDRCSSAGCSHTCISAHTNAFCTCPEGLLLGPDWRTCQDIDECANADINATCTFGCLNTHGSYRCIQPEELQGDQTINYDAPNNIACPPLYPPEHGYYECKDDMVTTPGALSPTGRRRITNRPGICCTLMCPEQKFKLVGISRRICNTEGKWTGPDHGKCESIKHDSIPK